MSPLQFLHVGCLSVRERADTNRPSRTSGGSRTVQTRGPEEEENGGT